MIDKITTYKPTGPTLRILTNYSDGIHPLPGPRMLTAEWTPGTEKPPKPVKDMNEEERADEIIRRLSRPPKSKGQLAEERMIRELGDEICREIDKGWLEECLKSSATKTY